MINIAILGYGTVGSGVYRVFTTNHKIIENRLGEAIRIKYVLDLRDFPGDPAEDVLVHDFQVILDDPEVAIVAEVMGGTGAAYTFTKKALEAGKSVCTSNKALVAEHGRELMRIAREKGVSYLFEASCGGGIPIIRAINDGLTADEIDTVAGILNGTTNYMMYKMGEEGSDFEETLKEAQAMGYAEADPTDDVEGHDACRKTAILSTLAYGKYVDYRSIPTEGITKITSEDMKYAAAMGCRIKLLGFSTNTEKGVTAIVAPFLVDKDQALYNVNDVFNGIFVHGNMLGDAMFYGSGAGMLPTASAVSADIVDAAMHLNKTVRTNWTDEEAQMVDPGDARWKFFVRTRDIPEEDVFSILPGSRVFRIAKIPEETGYITPFMKQADFDKKQARLGDKVISVIRVFAKE
ncbi:MAG: homoserine dehydrogenase [Blautia sp.]|nr:homoserine dehydrogenase [Blautia sp.]